ncbi:flagellar protein FlaG [Paenibacillus donghaensis]|uniref:flagellar protein FlaG n=1 Tax=Paenibacillus donghaensis TaxID=414771 RepID=UPI00188463E1|nr:flagellar protein FlaG [Paenibacillus donghaensis]MBE9916646.1 flagellar protein FlaG [Paenibacillus donghaensis]
MSDVSLSGRTQSMNAASQTYPPVKKALEQEQATALMTNEKQVNLLERQGANVSIGEAQLIKAIDRAIKALEGPSTTFEVSVHKPTQSIMVKVLNKDTGELIREIPPEKTLDLVAKMMEFAGILIDERV